MHKIALCFGFLLCCLPAMAQEQADATPMSTAETGLATTKIVKRKSMINVVYPNHTWVIEVRGKTFGIVEWNFTHSEIVVASRSYALPFSAVAMLTMCVLILFAIAIFPRIAARRKP